MIDLGRVLPMYWTYRLILVEIKRPERRMGMESFFPSRHRLNPSYSFWEHSNRQVGM